MSNINYSVGGARQVFGPNKGEIVYRPYLQLTGVMTLDDIALHMSDHNNKYDDGDITAVLKQFIRCVCEMVLEGYKIDLGRLGCLKPSIRVTGELSAEKVTAANIVELRLSWLPGEMSGNLIQKASFTHVAKRKNQKELVRAEKNGQSSVDLSQSSVPGDKGTNGGSTGSGGAGGE